MYAILSHGGRQYRVSAGDRLIVDRLAAEVGSVIALEPVLLTGGDGETGLGKDLEGMRVAATVVAHRRGKKLRIFKYKAKKRYRKAAGYRSDLTELRVESIVAKGAALPKATTAARAERTAGDGDDAGSTGGTAAPARPARTPAAKAAKAAAPAKAATPAAKAAPHSDAESVGDDDAVAATTAVDVAPKPAKRATKPTRTKSDSGAAATDEETGDGS